MAGFISSETPGVAVLIKTVDNERSYDHFKLEVESDENFAKNPIISIRFERCILALLDRVRKYALSTYKLTCGDIPGSSDSQSRTLRMEGLVGLGRKSEPKTLD